MKILIVEPFYQSKEYPWTEETKKAFRLDSADADYLEKGRVLFRGEVAFSLEETE